MYITDEVEINEELASTSIQKIEIDNNSYIKNYESN